jgi:hypothetical protein
MLMMGRPSPGGAPSVEMLPGRLTTKQEEIPAQELPTIHFKMEN